MPQDAVLRLGLRFALCCPRLAFFFPRVPAGFGLVAELVEDFDPLFGDKDSALATTLAVFAARVPATDPATRANLIIRASGEACFRPGMVSPWAIRNFGDSSPPRVAFSH
jgi:hypothetical protein